MNLFEWVRIEAETLMQERATKDERKLNVQLQQHFNNVATVQRKVRKVDGDIIQMTQQAKALNMNDDLKSRVYQTVLFHGLTRAAEKKTFIQTDAKGSMKTWTEMVA